MVIKENSNIDIDCISRAVIKFHKKVKEYLNSRSMIDGYTVTIRDTIETAKFVNYFKDSLGLREAVILGISRQYISKLKNVDKPEIIEVLKEIDRSNFDHDSETKDIDEIIYLCGKSLNYDLARILSGSEEEQLANLFHIFTRRAPKIMQDNIDVLQEMLLSKNKKVLVAAIKALDFLPKEIKKIIVEFGIDTYIEDDEILQKLMILAAGINDDLWKKGIIEDDLLVKLWACQDDSTIEITICTIRIIAASLKDEKMKQQVIEDLILFKLKSVDNNIRLSATGALWALCKGVGDAIWKKEIIEKYLLNTISDKSGSVVVWGIKAIAVLTVGVKDDKWKNKIVQDDLQPRFYHKYDNVRSAAIEAIGIIFSESEDAKYKKQIVEDYLMEKLFDKRNVQLKVMESLIKIFSTIYDDNWKQDIVQNDLLPRLNDRREKQTIIIAKIYELFLYIKDDKWKQEIAADYLFPKLKSRDWYIHSETLKSLGHLNKSIDDQEWKKQIVVEHLAPRLSFEDKDIQASALVAIGAISAGNGNEKWLKELLNDYLLPKCLNKSEDDRKVRESLFCAIGDIVLEIGDEKLRQNVLKKYLINGFNDNSEDALASAGSICKIIAYQLKQNTSTADSVFSENLKLYLSKGKNGSILDNSISDIVKDTNDEVVIGRFVIKKNKKKSPHIPDKIDSVLVNTKTTVEDLEFLASSVIIDKPVLEIGPTATRKSTLIQYLAFLTNTPYRRFNLNGQTDKYEFIGGYKPRNITVNIAEAKAIINRTIEDGECETVVSAVTKYTGEKYSKESAAKFIQNVLKMGNDNKILSIATLILDRESQLEWQDGILIEALKNGYYLNLDELNLSETEVLERINPLLDDEASIVVYEHENEKYIKEDLYKEQIDKYMQVYKDKTKQDAIKYLTNENIFMINGNFRLFATMNPKEYKGRNKLSDPFLNRWRILRIEELPDEELIEIIRSKYNVSTELIIPLILFHQSIRDQAEKGVLGKQQREEYHFTIRDLIRVFERVKTELDLDGNSCKDGDLNILKQHIAEAVNEVYGMVFRDEEDRNKYDDFFKKTFGSFKTQDENFKDEKYRENYINCNDRSKVKIGGNNSVELVVNKDNDSPHIPSNVSALAPVATTLKYIKTIAHSLELGEALHLVGPTASAKTSIIRYLAYLTNSGFQRLSLAGQTDTADIIGQYQATNIRGHYSWQDGTLLQAMKEGDYLLLDELNLAEPQILERLNSLLDTGRIVISEHNNETYIKANVFDKMVLEQKIDVNDKSFIRIHDNFRIIAASNPIDIRHQGRTRLSLAFRNRFREIWMEEIDNEDELTQILYRIFRV